MSLLPFLGFFLLGVLGPLAWVFYWRRLYYSDGRKWNAIDENWRKAHTELSQMLRARGEELLEQQRTHWRVRDALVGLVEKSEAELKTARDRANALAAQRPHEKLGGDVCVIESLRRRLKEAEVDVRSWRRKAEAVRLDTSRLDYAEKHAVTVRGSWDSHASSLAGDPGLRAIIDGFMNTGSEKQAL